MPDRRRNRGAHPADHRDFATDQLAVLRRAASELGWLLDRGYSASAAATLVGDRHRLRARQRAALQRTVAAAEDCARRQARQAGLSDLGAGGLLIDGYNVLLTVETAISGGVVLGCRDGTVRDLAAMSRHYRRVEQTVPALLDVGRVLNACAPDVCVEWLLDRPVSNSARLAALIREAATAEGWRWSVRLEPDVDRRLASSTEVVATADSGVLDRCGRWLNLAREVVERLEQVWWVELGGGTAAVEDEDPHQAGPG